MPLPFVRLHRLDHFVVGAPDATVQCPRDGVLDMEVADQQRVGVTEGDPANHGRRPRSHPGNGEQKPGVIRGVVDVVPVSDQMPAEASHIHDGVSPLALDSQRMQLDI